MAQTQSGGIDAGVIDRRGEEHSLDWWEACRRDYPRQHSHCYEEQEDTAKRHFELFCEGYKEDMKRRREVECSTLSSWTELVKGLSRLG